MPDILVVDDNDANRYYLESLFGGHGYSVVSAGDGQSALALAREEPPRLVIADILMPVMDGYALCREWRIDPQLAGIPFVFYTATYTDARDAEFALKLGADRFLIKPLPPEELMAVVVELVSVPQVEHEIGENFLPEAFKEHNEVLLRKLYKKVNDLQRSNDLLEQEIQSRREAEAQLIHAQKMEAVGRLAGGIAHDLNNILTAMYGLAQLLGDDLPEGGSARDYLQDIIACMDRASALSRSILSVSRRQEMEMHILDLNEVVGGMGMIVRQILGRNIRYEARLAAAPLMIRADRGQIEQVLMNLVVNARDAISVEGRVDIETASTDDGKVLLTVRDSGAGMDESVRQRIFEPFFTTKDAGKGTGLGLSIVFGILAEHRASIEVESAPGAGTAFAIRFDKETDAACAPVCQSEAGGVVPLAGLPQQTVLLVDDDDSIRKSSRLILERAGFAVREASDGESAIRLVQDLSVPLSLAVIDLFMPGRNGHEVLALAREIRPALPVILLSGCFGSSDEGVGEGLAPVRLLAKPVLPNRLVRTVQECLGLLENLS